MKVPKVPLSADGDRMLTGPEPGPFFFPDGRVNLKDQKPVFDYFKVREGLASRFEMHLEPALRRIIIEDLFFRHESGFVVINSDDTEIATVIRDAIISYHVEKARAKFNG